MDKENVHRSDPFTRIPLPLHPLPALPEHLVKRTSTKGKTRCPLEILHENNNNIPSTSADVQKKIQNRPIKKSRVIMLDTRHVTMRHKDESLDWEFRALRDDSDEELGEKNYEEFGEKKSVKNLLALGFDLTPPVNAAKDKNSKNIKQSLKRPHSRAMQGLSPGVKQKKCDQKRKRGSKLNESLAKILQPLDYWTKQYTYCLSRDYAGDLFKHLLATEQKSRGVPNVASITRACLINWLMKVNGSHGNPAVVQSACWYLDSILGNCSVRLCKLQLVATACLWLAQKIHGTCTSASQLVTISNNAFTVQMLKVAERVVLEKLKFPPQPVVPQEFIAYWSWLCDSCNPGEIEVAATFICMSGLIVIKGLTDEYPSVIAAAAIRNALQLLNKSELLALLQLCPVYRAAEMKTESMLFVLRHLRSAVRTISAPIYEYKAPLEFYGIPPFCIAQKVINAANKIVLMDARRISRNSVSFREQ